MYLNVSLSAVEDDSYSENILFSLIALQLRSV